MVRSKSDNLVVPSTRDAVPGLNSPSREEIRQLHGPLVRLEAMLLTAFIAVPDVAIYRYVRSPLDSELLKIFDESICLFLRQNAFK